MNQGFSVLGQFEEGTSFGLGQLSLAQGNTIGFTNVTALSTSELARGTAVGYDGISRKESGSELNWDFNGLSLSKVTHKV